MIFLNHLRNQTYEKKRAFARIFSIAFGLLLVCIWGIYTFGYAGKKIELPDVKTPFSAISSSAGDVVESVTTGINNLKKK